MPGTPPRLSAVELPRPLSRIELRSVVAGSRPSAPVDLLALGRGLDASQRNDSDYYLNTPELEAQPAILLASQLATFCRAGAPELASICKCLESVDPADLSAGIDRLRALLLDEEPIAAELLAQLRGDPGLEDAAVATILGYGALEQYYRAQATPSAKLRFDAHRDLIHVATGCQIEAINAEASIGGGLRVWEGWQAIVALTELFGLTPIIEFIEAQSETITLGLLVGADTLLRTTERALPADFDAALDDLWRYAKERRQARDFSPLSRARDAFFRPPPAGPSHARRSEAATDPNLLPSKPLSQEARRSLALRSIAAPEPSTPKTPAAFIEELASVLERYEVLVVGDDNSLVFEVAPVLFQAFLGVYQSLSTEHPQLERALYEESAELDDRARREVLALRVLVARAVDLERRYLQLVEAVELASAPPERAESPTPIASPQVPANVVEAQAEALLLVLTARGLDPPPPLVSAIRRSRDQAEFRRWLARAAVATNLTEVFADPRPPEDTADLVAER